MTICIGEARGRTALALVEVDYGPLKEPTEGVAFSCDEIAEHYVKQLVRFTVAPLKSCSTALRQGYW